MSADLLALAAVFGVTAVAVSVCYVYLKSYAKVLEGLKHISKAPKTQGSSWLLGALKDLTSPDVHLRITKWANELGPLYTLNLMGSTVVVLSDPDLVKPLVTRGETELPKYAPAYTAANQLGTAQKLPALFTMTHETPQYAAVRKATAPAFAQSNLAKRFPKIRAKGLRLVECIAAAAQEGQELDLSPLIVAATFDLVASTGFDVDFKALDDPVNNVFLKAIKGGLREISARVTDPLRETLQTVFWFLPSSRKVLQDFRSAYTVYEHIVKELRSRGEPRESDQSIGACLMRVRDPDTGKPLSDLQLQANIAAFLVGGFETSSATVQWALYNIARLPDIAQKLIQELTEAGLIQPDGKPGRLPEWNDLTALPYFNAVVKESMRLHNVAGATATFRAAEQPMQLGEYWVAKGTPIWMPAHTLANATHNWPAPDEFRPERWMPGSAVASPHDWTSMVFSQGTRSCPGTNQGLAQVRTLLLVLLTQLKFALGPTLADHEAVQASQVMALVVTSSKGTPLIVSRR